MRCESSAPQPQYTHTHKMDEMKTSEVRKEDIDTEKVSKEASNDGFVVPTAEEEARIIRKLDLR